MTTEPNAPSEFPTLEEIATWCGIKPEPAGPMMSRAPKPFIPVSLTTWKRLLVAAGDRHRLVAALADATMTIRGIERLVTPQEGEHVVDAVARRVESRDSPGVSPEVRALREECERLRGLLVPFADAEESDTNSVGCVEVLVPLSDLRAARAAVARSQ